MLHGGISTTDVGLRPAIIHFQNLHDRDVNTAWTISIIKGLILTLCLVVISPYIALFFNSPKLQGMLVILSLVLFIQGFENIWTTKLEVAVSFKCIEFVNQLAWVIGPCVSILIIIFTMTIWGPIIGIITRYSIIVAGSYFIVREKPKLIIFRDSLIKFIRYLKYLLLGSIILYCVNYGDNLIVGKLLGCKELGYYAFAFTLGILPLNFFLTIYGKVTTPIFSMNPK